MVKIVKYLCVLVANVSLLCTNMSPASNNPGGGGTETTNALVLVADGLNVYGEAPEGTVISIYFGSYNPLYDDMYCDSITVDSSKIFRVTSVRNNGIYNIFAINKPSNSGLLIPYVNLSSGKYDSIHIPFDTLGVITGSVSSGWSNTSTRPVSGVYVYCEGTGNFTQADSSGSFIIENIPVGTYRVKLSDQPVSVGGDDEKTAVISYKQPVASVEFLINP